jgi:hypothetical protein
VSLINLNRRKSLTSLHLRQGGGNISARVAEIKDLGAVCDLRRGGGNVSARVAEMSPPGWRKCLRQGGGNQETLHDDVVALSACSGFFSVKIASMMCLSSDFHCICVDW